MIGLIGNSSLGLVYSRSDSAVCMNLQIPKTNVSPTHGLHHKQFEINL